MKASTKDIENIIKGNNRTYTASLCFNFLSVKNPESILIKAANSYQGGIPDQIVFPYLFHIQNRLFEGSPESYRAFPNPQNIHSDGNLHRVKKRPYSHIGYIGKRADNNGTVDDSIELFFPSIETKKITLRTNSDRIIKNAKIIAKRHGQEVNSFEIIDNTKSELVFDFENKNITSLELQITKHTANKRIWIVSFYPGFEFFVDEKDIVKFKHKKKKTENKEGSIGRVYINSIDLTLANTNRIYDELNTQSPVAGHFNSNAILSCVLKLKTPKNRKAFYLNLGSFFVREIKNIESSATVTVKAQDYIGLNKNTYIALGIEDETNAHSCFAKIANALNLSASKIDSPLKNIELSRFPLNGQAGSLLNKLAVLTNAFVSVDETGAALIATPMLSRHGAMRYPLRYFLLDEYKQSNSGQKKDKSPNVINLSYNTFEYDGEYQAGKKEVLFYKDLPQLQFPHSLKDVPFTERPVGAGLTPSIVKEYELSSFKKFVTVEFSDPLIPQLLEYETAYEYTDDGKPKKTTVSIWNFTEHNEGEQLTVMLMVMEKPHNKLLKKEEFTIPKMPYSYTAPEHDPALNPQDMIKVEKRNAKNKPVIFKVEFKEAAKISRVEVANHFVQTKFEFAYYKTAEGIEVKVWNYFKENEQTVTVNIYGNRLIAGKEKKTITARNESDIQVNGEIEKTIEVGSLASDEIARSVLKSFAFYYRHFTTDIQVQTWADPRLFLYDLIAFKSLRGYGFYQGIIDEVELEYTGALSQKLKIKQTKKHTRDCRVLSGFVLKDRPVIAKNYTSFA